LNQALLRYRPVEYDILGVEPLPWTVEDTILVSLLQAWSLTHNWEQEMVRFLFALHQGKDFSEKTYPNVPLSEAATIKSKVRSFPIPTAITPELENFLSQYKIAKTPGTSYLTDITAHRPGGSNAWVVGGQHTKSGKPILANDMHLSHSLPSMLYLQHIKTPEVDAIGVTMPGLPFIVGGHNQHLAWGATAAVADVVDLLVEKIDPKNSNAVVDAKQVCPITKEEQVVRVRDGKNYLEKKFTLRHTCHGPVINDMYPDLLPLNAPIVSIKWEIPGVTESLYHLYQGMKSSSIDEFRSHVMKIPSPVQNITIASVSGDIAFFPTGAVPLRTKQSGTFPRPGWTAEYDWKGFTAKEQMPYVKNPEEGMLANGNNMAVHPASHQPFYQIDAAPGYRYDRIMQRLEEKPGHDLESVTDPQLDHFLLRAKLITPILLSDLEELQDLTDEEVWALEDLKSWDFYSPKESKATLIFFEIFRQSIHLALEDKVSASAMRFFLKQRYSTNTVDLWFLDEKHPVWDNPATKVKEVRSERLKEALTASMKSLNDLLGKDKTDWQWGKLHYHRPQHFFGSKSVLSFFNLESMGMDGELDSVWKAHFNLANDEPFKVVAGPAVRTSMDLSNWNNSYFTIDTGNSGWPLSPHYGDLYQGWKKGKLVPMHYDWAKIREKFKDRHFQFVGAQ
jgi:penicillin amidase